MTGGQHSGPAFGNQPPDPLWPTTIHSDPPYTLKVDFTCSFQPALPALPALQLKFPCFLSTLELDLPIWLCAGPAEPRPNAFATEGILEYGKGKGKDKSKGRTRYCSSCMLFIIDR